MHNRDVSTECLHKPNNPKLLKLLKIMEDGWDRIGVRAKNAGHHSLWPEAFEAGKAPRVNLTSTHLHTLEFVNLADLERFAV